MFRLQNGFVYLWALFSVMLAGVTMAGAAQIWQTKSQREKEAELMFIGEEFRRAIMSYYNSGPKQYPNSLEDLLKDSRTPNVRRHLRKLYVDPITNTPEWGLVRESDNTTASNNTSPANNNPASSKQQTSASNPTSAVNPISGNPQSPNNSPPLINNQTSSTAQSNNKDAAPANSSQPNNSSGVSSSISKGITGVYSLSERKPIKKDQFPEHLSKFSEAVTYNGWQFVYKPGENKSPGASGSASTKSSATPSAASGSPFSPQSATSKGASPFSPQSSSSADSRAPAIGSPAQNND